MSNHPSLTFSPLVNSFGDIRRALQNIRVVVDRMNRGKINFSTELTLTANSATTTFTENRLNYDSVLIFDPITANARAEIQANGPPYAATAGRIQGEFTLNHANNSQTDRTFYVAILG